MNAISKEVTGPNAMGKHSLLSDPRIESPPKRPKSAEGKTSASEQVSSKIRKEKKAIFRLWRLASERKSIFSYGTFGQI